jgi:DNA-binding transcriptional regulator LsrR (DeoR family)
MPGEVAKAHVARLYFEHDLTKSEIAERLGISRFKVARLLDQARADGIVRVEIDDPVEIQSQSDLSRALEATFDLDLAVVVRDQRAIPRAVSAWLPELLRDGDTLGVAWGATLRDISVLIDGKPDTRIDVVQICGAVAGVEPGTGASELALRFADRLGGRLYPLPAPAVIGRSARDELLSSAVVAPTVARFDRVDVALVGIGDSAELGDHPPTAAGSVLVHFFDAAGRPVEAAATANAIAMSRTQLEATRLVAAAGGPAKRGGIIGALHTGLLDVLVTDAATASHALEHKR